MAGVVSVGKPIINPDGSYIGEIRAFATSFPPDNWLECNGNEYEVTQYEKLAKVIGNLWGSSTINKFRLPNLQGTFLRGWHHNRADGGGDPESGTRQLPIGAPGADSNVVGSFQQDAVGEHFHTMTLPMKWGDKGRFESGWGGDDANRGNDTHKTDPTGNRETRPRNAYVLFCIRAK
jgi:Phage Tail Collar Domain